MAYVIYYVDIDALFINTDEPKKKPKEFFIVVTDITNPPFSNEGFVGFEVDLLNEIASVAGVKIKWEEERFLKALGGTVNGKYDIAIANIEITDDRRENLFFTEPYFESGTSIVVSNKYKNVTKYEQLEGKTIGTLVNTNAFAKKIKGATVYEFERIRDIFKAVENGMTVAAIYDSMYIKNYLASGGDKFVHLIDYSDDVKKFSIAISKNNPELVKKFNEALKDIKSSGKYKEIYDKYFKEKTSK
jgi:ABC-type amino acid transport substrate-binding protein